MSVASQSTIDDGPPVKVAVPQTRVALKKPPQNPQEKIDVFWSKFKTKAPGKATSIIPQKEYAERAAQRASAKAVGPAQTTQASYEEAAAQCRLKVAQVVKECRRVNQKYRDPHFDLEIDLKLNRRDCLDSLDNSKETTRRRRRRSEDDEFLSRREQPLKDRVRNDSILGMLRDADRDVPLPDADSDSIFRPQAVKRVVDIFDKPQFYIDGPTANDVRQGRDGDCWLMAALCTLSNKPGLIEKICIDHDQEVGVYGFVFHRDGEWFSEIIDDKLYLTKPDYDESLFERILWEDRERVNSEEAYRKIYQSNSGALYFAQCENPNETWLPLLEKAYAKAHGDYSAIEGGYGGEGIEDLTGGVTSEIYTTDILDKEYFWTEELMKVNQEFLFGCSTGVWGRGWGERKGIVELHAYSVLKAREVDGVRLVLLKNPWGKHEWKGPWSDGSKEWTAEWLQKLEHQFGDDGSFWISYEDLLRKYQAFDRTRLFGPDWKVSSIWTTLNVSWNLDYHDTRFAFSLIKPGPVVIVFSQLDERYFQGLEGPYRFELSFRLHKAGEEDYVVRSQNYYRMNRSVNVELSDLEAGEYVVVVKIDAQRSERVKPVEDVVRFHANTRREKLIRIGLAYDVAHSKGKIIETAEEKAAREAYEKKKKEKQRRDYRKKFMEQRQRDYEADVKLLLKRRKKAEDKKVRQKARNERRKAKREARIAEMEQKGAEEAKKAEKQKVVESELKKDDTPTDPKPTMDELPTPLSAEKSTSIAAKDAQKALKDDTSTTPKASITTTTAGQSPSSEEEKVPAKLGATSEEDIKVDIPENTKKAESLKDSDASTDKGENTPASSTILENPPLEGVKAEIRPKETNTTPEKKETVSISSTVQTETTATVTDNQGSSSEMPMPRKEDEKKSNGNASPSVEPKETPGSSLPKSGAETSTPPSEAKPTLEPARKDTGMQTVEDRRTRPQSPPLIHFNTPRPNHGPPAWHNAPGRGSPRRPPGCDDSSDSEIDEDLRSISSVSDISDREIDSYLKHVARPGTPIDAPVPVALPPHPLEEEDEFEKDPWNAVGVFGLRVYYKVTEEDKDTDIVKLRVERPNPYVDHDDENDSEDENRKGDDKEKIKGPEDKTKECKALDVDDSAKDATLKSEPSTLEDFEDTIKSSEDNTESSALDVDDSAKDATLEAGETAQGDESKKTEQPEENKKAQTPEQPEISGKPQKTEEEPANSDSTDDSKRLEDPKVENESKNMGISTRPTAANDAPNPGFQ